ncbi:MAG: RNA-binding protein [Lachnospiraceae bacterium]|nr:RNA-binding protein [Lachnospiraceae bacterium]
MIQIGRWNDLTIIRSKDFGAYLGERDNPSETVLLPRKQVPEGAKAGTDMTVFIYRDSEDRLIATVNKPYITMDNMAKLRVKSVTGVGAFMDWGLEKDIFLPFKEQTAKVEEGRSYLVRMYADKSDRLCVSMKLSNHLERIPVSKEHSDGAVYQRGDSFTGTVYEYKKNMGAFVAIDDRYYGLIHSNELFQKVCVGDTVTGRIVNIREDGKADLAIRKEAYKQMDDDSEMVYGIIKSYKGVLPFTDKAAPERIKKEFGLSKNAFKRAVGHLLKEGRIVIKENSIEIVE